MPYRRIQVERRGGDRVTGIAWGQRRAGLGQAGTGGPMDRPVHATPTEQRLVRGGHDRIHPLGGDVTEHDFNGRHCR